MRKSIFIRQSLLSLSLIVPSLFVSSQAEEMLWKQADDGIILDVHKKGFDSHKDHYAMSGRGVDLILEWEINKDKNFEAERWTRWPMLRTKPNDTHAAFNERFSTANDPVLTVNEKKLDKGKVVSVEIDGIFSVKSDHADGIKTTRRILPASSAPAVIDFIEVENTSNKTASVLVPAWKKEHKTKPEVRGVYTVYEYLLGEGDYTLAPGEKISYSLVRGARLEEEAPYCDSAEAEIAAREAFLSEMKNLLVLDTPNAVIDQMFQLAKVRATESIFSTRGGLMHGPGGYNKFLAAIWTNDQIEYVNPFFPFLGNKLGNESAMNSYRMFARFMNPEYKKIPSSIIAEGLGTWGGAGDRGDQAMLAYGAGRFVLASGNKAWGKELLPLIDWCLEYGNRHKNTEGVITSDSDELEGRFPSGKANLCTNTLHYDALITAAKLWKEIDPSSDKIATYQREAEELKSAIKKYFEGTVEGFDTYKYYENNDVLRSWICMPLVVGINDRAEKTTEALFSPKLWFGNGMLTASGSKTYWDRSALYAFRGIFAAGQQDKALQKLVDYSNERLLGQHVPYAIEAWPEAGQSHLSAESGLYCRIFTEGLFGMTPDGFRSFSLLPRLPKEWKTASLKNIKAFGSTFDISLNRLKSGVEAKVTDSAGKVLYKETKKDGEVHSISLPR